jgi:hypothetical protein
MYQIFSIHYENRRKSGQCCLELTFIYLKKIQNLPDWNNLPNEWS